MVEFKNVWFKYHPEADEYILKDINLIIEAGETVAIIGATGSSKTTLVELIPRLYDVSNGQVLIDGVDVRDYTLPNLRHNLKLVLQQNQLFSGTIKQNLKWGNSLATDEEIMNAARDAQGHEFIMSFPQQYDTLLGEGGVNISGEQKQHICIARAILRKPIVLILDDSTSVVDIATEAKIRTSLTQHLQVTTTLMITQRISSIGVGNRIIVLDNGTIVSKGYHNELLKNNAVYQEIYASQQLERETDQ